MAPLSFPKLTANYSPISRSAYEKEAQSGEDDAAPQRAFSFLPIRSFSARLTEDWRDDFESECRVVGLIAPNDDIEGEDGMPSLSFVVIARIDGSLIPRIVPALDGDLPN